jgi:hypothetical protein
LYDKRFAGFAAAFFFVAFAIESTLLSMRLTATSFGHWDAVAEPVSPRRSAGRVDVRLIKEKNKREEHQMIPDQSRTTNHVRSL